MTTIIEFPQQARLVLTEGVDVQSGRETFILEHISAAGRSVVSVRNTRLEIVQDAINWENDGVPFGGAA